MRFGQINSINLLMNENFFISNYRGAGNKEFLREILEWRRIYKPAVIALSEPRISGSMADEVCEKLGKTHWIRSEAEGSTEVFGFCGMSLTSRSSWLRCISLSFMLK